MIKYGWEEEKKSRPELTSLLLKFIY